MNILLTGATGFIGSTLCSRLLKEGHNVYAWVRNMPRAKMILDGRVQSFEELEQLGNTEINAVINLAGEPIADKPWTESRKQLLLDSRVGVTQDLVAFFQERSKQPTVLLSGSAIGFYGSQDRQVPLDETADATPGFSHELCAQWEVAAMGFDNKKTRVCLIRTGIVLGKNGGALGKMLLPFKLGLGGPIGNGQQVMSWIHIDDWINACLMLLYREELSGPFNFVSPNPVDNKTFSRALARAVRRPTIFRVPCFLLKMFLGEASELLCKGQRVIPKKLLFAGYQFEFTNINQALADIV